MRKLTEYTKAQDKWLKETGLKKGDRVLVIDPADSWFEEKDWRKHPSAVGKEHRVHIIVERGEYEHAHSDWKYAAICIGTNIWFPFWALVKV